MAFRATDKLSTLLLRKMEMSAEAEASGIWIGPGHLSLISTGQAPGCFPEWEARGFSAIRA